MHKLFTVMLLLCWLCVACCFIAPHVTWVPLPPGAGTCRNLCSKLTWAPVTLDGFENNQSEDLLCGRVVGARLLAGTTAGKDCRMFDTATNKPITAGAGKYLCGCDTTYAASSFEWRVMAGCPRDKMTAFAVVCAGLLSMTDYSFGYVANVGGVSKCVTPDGTADSFKVLCDYP